MRTPFSRLNGRYRHVTLACRRYRYIDAAGPRLRHLSRAVPVLDPYFTRISSGGVEHVRARANFSLNQSFWL